MQRLVGKVAMITGAVGAIGAATVRKCAVEGANLVLTDFADDGAEQLLEEARAIGSRAIFLPMDVTSRAAVYEAVQQAEKEFGKIDILVNNAGIALYGAIETITDPDWDKVIAVNLTGVFLCTQAVAEGMKARNYGRIVNIGSLVGKVGGVLTPYGQVTSPSYAASKGGVMAMTKTLAKDLGPFGITVNALAPGPIATPMIASFSSSVVTYLEGAIPLGRLGQPEDVANAVAFLASDEASWITGHWLDIDGGLMMA